VIAETKDSELIRSIVTLPELWETIAEDGVSLESWKPDLNEGWLISSDDKGFIGIYVVDSSNDA
jgi:hypothetical protein